MTYQPMRVIIVRRRRYDATGHIICLSSDAQPSFIRRRCAVSNKILPGQPERILREEAASRDARRHFSEEAFEMTSQAK